MGEKRRVIGFDMGGTKMLSVVLDDEYKEKGRAKMRTPIGAGNEKTLSAIADLVSEALDDADTEATEVVAIGIAVPGPIDRERGHVIRMPNAGMHDFALRDELEKKVGIPVVLENDVNAGTYGEYVAGAAKGCDNVIGVFPGTGVGGGIIIGGKLYRGRTGSAGEVGHMIIDAGGRRCGCGKHGCLEALSSKTAIAKELVHLALNGQAPTVLSKAGTDIGKIKSSVIEKAMDAGEKAVIEVVERAAWYLGVGLGSLVDIFDPDVIVVGGGLVEKLGKRYLKPIEASMREHSMIKSDVELVAASLGDDSVIIGAGALAWQAQG
ncbi:MAG: ROK family protein [Spirochaetota bacterium]